MRQVAQGFCKVAPIVIIDQTAGVEAIQKLEELYPQITQIPADLIRRVKTTPPGIKNISTFAI